MKPEIINKLLNIVQDNYQEIAREFDATRKKKIWPFLEAYCHNIPSKSTVLDLGCGNGRLCGQLLEKEVDYLGVDSSFNLIELARKNYSEFNFIQGDFLKLDPIIFANKKFQRIFLLAALQHVPTQGLRLEVLKNIKRLLDDRGEVLVSNWNIWQSKHRYKIFKNYLLKIIGLSKVGFNDIIFPWQGKRGQQSLRYYHAFTEKELVSLAKQAGFKKVVLKVDKYNYWLILS